MKSFDEYFKDAIKTSTSDQSTRFIMQCAGEQFRADYLNEPSSDPLAEWKALEPGRKVLRIKQNGRHYICTFEGLTDNSVILNVKGNILHVPFRDPVGYLKKFQILQSGPFDASKLKVGDWVWVEWSPGDGSIDRWDTIRSINVHDCYVAGYGWNKDGTMANSPDHSRLHFSPPTPDPVEKAVDAIWSKYCKEESSKDYIRRIIKEARSCGN
jgi:hypothetical protein